MRGAVEKALQRVPGVLSASVNLATEQATIEALATVPASTLRSAIESAGYGARDASTAPGQSAAS